MQTYHINAMFRKANKYCYHNPANPQSQRMISLALKGGGASVELTN